MLDEIAWLYNLRGNESVHRMQPITLESNAT